MPLNGEIEFSIRENDRCVNAVQRQYKTGTTATGKTWSRWDDYSRVMYSDRSGRLRVYIRGRLSDRSKYFHEDTSRSLERLMYNASELDSSFHNVFGMVARDKVVHDYPLIEDFVPKTGMVTYLTETNVPDMLKRVMGKHYQKTLIRHLRDITTNARSDYLFFLMTWKGLVPTDWLGSIESAPRYWYREDIQCIRNLLKEFRLSDRKRILAEMTAAERHTSALAYDDIAGVANSFNGEPRLPDGYRYHGANVLHREFAPQIRWARDGSGVSTEYSFTYSGKTQQLGDISQHLVLPETASEMCEWSSQMHNCVSSFASKVNSGGTAIYGVKDGENLIGNLEIDPKTGDVRQLLGKYNKSLPENWLETVYADIQKIWPGAKVYGGWQ